MNSWTISLVQATIAGSITLTSTVAYTAAKEEPMVDQRYRKGTSSAHDSEVTSASLNYRLLCPPKTKRNLAYPLLVYLHGSGERGDDNQRQLVGLPTLMAQRQTRLDFPCYVLAPQCPSGASWQQRVEQVLACIDEIIAQHSVDHSRIYLTGYSMGAHSCWIIAARRPNLFAAVVPVAGRSDVALAPLLVDVPICAVHGDSDEVVSVSHSRDMVAAINDIGGNAQLTELEGVNHDSWQQGYAGGAIQWMFAQSSRVRWWKRNLPLMLLIAFDAAIVLWIIKEVCRISVARRARNTPHGG